MRRSILHKVLILLVFLNIAQFVLFAILYSGSINPLRYRYRTNKNFDQLLRQYDALLRERKIYSQLRTDIVNENIMSTHSLAVRLESGIREIWEFVKANKIQNKQFFYDWYRLMTVYTRQIANASTFSRIKKFNELKEIVWSKLEMLNNPEVSNQTGCPLYNKLLDCQPMYSCGFGCRVHKKIWCSTAALALNRTLISSSYSELFFWDSKFNITKCDTSKFTISSWAKSMSKNPPEELDVDLLNIRMLEGFADKEAPFMPVRIPVEISAQLSELSENPFLLFISLISQYHFRHGSKNKTYTEKIINDYSNDIGLSLLDHYVGIHVRRTDKHSEAPYRNFSEYMTLVEEYYDRYDLQHAILDKGIGPIRRNVYLATDEPQLWTTDVAIYQMKGYRFFGDKQISISASTSKRYTDESLMGVYLDVYFLSNSNHFVGTFSSQIGRFAYELMQTNPKSGGMDMSLSGQTLDWPYHYGGAATRDLRAIIPNNVKGELQFSQNDLLGYERNHGNGYISGDNKNTIYQPIRPYPHYKAAEYPIRAPYRAFQ